MEVTLSPFATGAELAMIQCCSRMTAEKDGGDGEDAAGSASKRRRPMGGGYSTKVEVAKRGRQDWEEERGKSFEVRIAQWIGLRHREKVHEKIQRKVRYLFLDRAQNEERGNGGAVL